MATSSVTYCKEEWGIVRSAATDNPPFLLTKQSNLRVAHSGSRLLTSYNHALIERPHGNALGCGSAIAPYDSIHRICTGVLHRGKDAFGSDCFHCPAGPAR